MVEVVDEDEEEG